MPRGFASGGYSADTGFCRFRARELRKEAGLTLMGLSATIPGMSHSQISEWETGRSRICWANLQKLADGLGVPRVMLQHESEDSECSCSKELTR